VRDGAAHLGQALASRTLQAQPEPQQRAAEECCSRCGGPAGRGPLQETAAALRRSGLIPPPAFSQRHPSAAGAAPVRVMARACWSAAAASGMGWPVEVTPVLRPLPQPIPAAAGPLPPLYGRGECIASSPVSTPACCPAGSPSGSKTQFIRGPNRSDQPSLGPPSTLEDGHQTLAISPPCCSPRCAEAQLPASEIGRAAAGWQWPWSAPSFTGTPQTSTSSRSGACCAAASAHRAGYLDAAAILRRQLLAFVTLESRLQSGHRCPGPCLASSKPALDAVEKSGKQDFQRDTLP